ncbi:hypothetical protein AA0X95_04635 [Bacillus sp. 1P10SD]|uniref:hypothetical protein n=1 Tax=Bacillus sp. 1P10SD TaxID=3132265 RepID=UPI0039A71FCC
MKKCKQCGSTMKEDAWEEIHLMDDHMIVDSFLAWVCEKQCGYYEKMNGDIQDAN